MCTPRRYRKLKNMFAHRDELDVYHFAIPDFFHAVLLLLVGNCENYEITTAKQAGLNRMWNGSWCHSPFAQFAYEFVHTRKHRNLLTVKREKRKTGRANRRSVNRVFSKDLWKKNAFELSKNALGSTNLCF